MRSVRRLPSTVWGHLHTPVGDHRVRWRNVALSCVAITIGSALWAHAIGFWPHIGYDFHAYLTGAHQIADGQNPFQALVTQAPDTRKGDSGYHAHGYVYPPLLGMALSLPIRFGLNDYAVWMLWTLLNVAAVLWMGFELNLALRGNRDWPATLLFATAALLPAVVTYDLFLGQADLLMAALAAGACGLWLRKNPWAALPLGAAIAIKPTMGLLVLVWLWKGDWRAALRATAVALALVVIPFALVGWQAFQDYVTFFIHWNAFSANAEYINQSPYGMLLRLFTHNPYTQPLVAAQWLVAPLRYFSALAAVCLWLWTTPRQPTRDRALAMGEYLLALPLILLISPLAEDIHYCLLVPTLLGLGWLAWERGLWRGVRSAKSDTGRHIGQFSAWALWLTLALSCIPRMQELIYPDHLFAFPGQDTPGVGPLIALFRTGILLYCALVTLLAGAGILRAARRVSEQQEAPSAAAVQEADVEHELAMTHSRAGCSS